ncbi:LamG-like jellyroll fold domain-containing protein [Rubritalea tangerina]|uniref:LamG-like jellyroll fold domain-containing protein n=1 Tax=Rubritalea tangerina TaxID=430798 RepID=A0ABW4ZFV0_9BACT
MKPLEERIQALIDGSISEEEFQHLDDELLANPEARRIYYSYMVMHQGLEYRLSRSSSGVSPAAPIQGLAESRLKRQRVKALKVAAMSAAAVILCTLIVLKMYAIRWDSEGPTQFAAAPGTLYTLTHEGGEVDTESLELRQFSRLQISQGTIELQFASGVRSILTAPADVTLQDSDRLFMESGIAWFDVPKQAVGFTVKTREFEVVDLGTRFGVQAHPRDNDEVHVFEGAVAVTSLSGEEQQVTLKESQAKRVRFSGALEDVALAPERFITQLPDSLPHMHWSFDDAEELVETNQIVGMDALEYRLNGPSAGSRREPNLRSGVHGRALQLDGGCFLETNWEGILGDAPRTVAFWMKLPAMRRQVDVTNQKMILGWGRQSSGSADSTENNKWTIHMDPSAGRYPMLNLSFGGFWYFAPGLVLDDNQWHHIVVVYAGESNSEKMPRMKLFVDGQVANIKPAFHSPIDRDPLGQVHIDTKEKSPMVLGATLSGAAGRDYEEGPYLDISLDELFIIEGAITDREARALFKHNALSAP